MITATIPKTYQEAVGLLAEWHSAGGFADIVVYSFPDPEAETVRLVEVSPDFPATGEVVPVTFGKSREFPFRSTVIQVTPREWDQISAGAVQLPKDWSLADAVRVRPA